MRDWVRAGRMLKAAPGSFPALDLTHRLATAAFPTTPPGRNGTEAWQDGSDESSSGVAVTIEALCQCQRLAASRIPFRTDGSPMQSTTFLTRPPA